MGVKFVYGGVRDTMTGHARRLGISIKSVEARIMRYGNRPENYGLILCKGRISPRYGTTNVAALARRAGVNYGTVLTRLSRGATLTQALARGRWGGRGSARAQEAHGNHTRRKLAALGIFA